MRRDDLPQPLPKQLGASHLVMQQQVKGFHLRRPDAARLATQTCVGLAARRAVLARRSRLRKSRAAVFARAHHVPPPPDALINGKRRRCVANSGNCTILVAALINGFCDVTVLRASDKEPQWRNW